MYDVICIGSSTVDVFAQTEYSDLIKIKTSKGEEDFLAYPTGSKILIDELDFTTGGCGTNVAAALSALGLNTAYLGCLGNDENGDFIVQALVKHKVDPSLCVRKNGQTGYSIILDSIEHDRTILTHKGLNNDLKYSDINLKKIRTKWFYFSTMMKESFRTLEKLALFSEKNDIKIIFNPSSYLAKKGAKHLQKILSRSEILVLNREEAEYIVGEGDIKFLSIKLHELGPNYIVITDGKKGAYCYNDGFLYFAKTNNIEVVETTGAGDAFASTFLAAIIKGRDVEATMKMATTNSESVISHHGAKNTLLTVKGISTVLKKRPVSVNKKKI